MFEIKYENGSKVLSNKFQPTPPKKKHPSETSGDETDHPHALSARRASEPADRTVADVKTTISEPIKPVGKLTIGSVSFQFS